MIDRIDQLEAIAAIRIVKARYFRFMDTKQWDALATLFTSDMRVITPAGDVWLEGGAAFAASLRSSLEHSVSAHQGFTEEIEIVDADHATGVWAMQDVIRWEDRHPREGWKAIVGRGHYHDSFRRDDGAWRIATLSLVRTSLEIER